MHTPTRRSETLALLIALAGWAHSRHYYWILAEELRVSSAFTDHSISYALLTARPEVTKRSDFTHKRT
jgi:hypothetical protein